MAGWLLAIDFGTSNTAAAHTSVRTGEVETLPLSHRGAVMASAVLVESSQSILVGDVALDRAQSNPAAYVAAPKRLAGQGVHRVNGVDVADTTLVAAVLRSVVGRAVHAHNGHSPDLLTLTHPVGWSPAQIATLSGAAATIGFDARQVRVVSEPVAAARYYSRTSALPAGARIGVFDFGGGTLDVAVLEALDERTFDVVASRGDNRLGGRNLDAKLRQWVDHQLGEHDPALRDYLRTPAAARARVRLDESVRRAKELLTETLTATIAIDNPVGGQNTLTISRDELDSIIGDEIDRGILLARTVFHDANIRGPQDLHAIYLTGGSSRIPLVRERLKTFGPIATLDDPKTVVARGALHTTVTALAPDRTPEQPQSPAHSPTTPSSGNRRTFWLSAAAVAAVLAVGGIGAVVYAGRDNNSATTTAASDDTTSVSSIPSSPPRESAADEQTIKDLTTEFLAKAGSGTAAELNPLRCADQQGPTDTPAPAAEAVDYTVGDYISLDVSGDTGAARFRIQQTDSAGVTRTGIMVADYAYEDGSWKWCGSSIQ